MFDILKSCYGDVSKTTNPVVQGLHHQAVVDTAALSVRLSGALGLWGHLFPRLGGVLWKGLFCVFVMCKGNILAASPRPGFPQRLVLAARLLVNLVVSFALSSSLGVPLRWRFRVERRLLAVADVDPRSSFCDLHSAVGGEQDLKGSLTAGCFPQSLQGGADGPEY